MAPGDDRPRDEGEAGLQRRSRDSGRPPARGAYGLRADDRPWRPDRRSAGPAPSRPGPGRSGHGRPYGAPPPRLELGEDEEVVAGRRPVEEAFAASRAAHRLLVVPERRAALEQLVLHATTLRIPVVEVEGGSLTALTGFDGHQGVALVVEPRRWATLEDVIVAARARVGAAVRARARPPRGPPERRARCCAPPRPRASTASSSRPAARRP